MIQHLLELPDLGTGDGISNILSGGAGAGIMGLIILTVKIVLDRIIPSRKDTRDNVKLMLDGLNNMVKVLQEEKLADATRLEAKTKRIEDLESAAEQDFDRIFDLRAEINELQRRLAQKERHITILITELRKLGAIVSGVDLENPDDITITFPEKNATA